jgi:hypothetical protein
LKTGGESKASRSTVLRIFIWGMGGLLGKGSKPLILQGLPQNAGHLRNEVLADGVRVVGRRIHGTN